MPVRCRLRNPLLNRSYQLSPYLTTDFTTQSDLRLNNIAGVGLDPFLLAQDIPQKLKVEAFFIHEDEASSSSIELWAKSPSCYLTVDLVRADGDWQINNIARGNPTTPAGVVQLFYDSYLADVGDPVSGVPATL